MALFSRPPRDTTLDVTKPISGPKYAFLLRASNLESFAAWVSSGIKVLFIPTNLKLTNSIGNSPENACPYLVKCLSSKDEARFFSSSSSRELF